MKRPIKEDYLENENKAFGVFVRLAAGVSVSTIIFSISTILGAPFTLASGLISLGIGVPSTYIGLTKIREKIHNEYVKDMHLYEQFLRGLKDFEEMDKNGKVTIKEDTAVFYDIITKYDVMNKIPQSEYNNINAFLFMVNENYYNEIATDSYRDLTRETLLKMLMQIIISEFKPEEECFNEEVVEAVIERAFFIKEEVKEEMIAEFYSSKSRTLKETTFKIVSSRVSVKEIERGLDEQSKNQEYYTPDNGFNFKKAKHYEYLLDDLNNHESNVYGNYNEIKWDFKMFRDIIVMIDELFGEQLEELYDGYSIEALAATLLHNVAIYCTLNNKVEAGMQEILNAMREWHYLDYEDKLVIIESIYKEFTQMDDVKHPFYDSKYKVIDDSEVKEEQQNHHCKIIEFPTQKK